MNLLTLSVSEYRKTRIKHDMALNGSVDLEAIEEDVRRHSIARHEYKKQIQDGTFIDFDPFVDDPNCKTCGKNKGKDNAQ